jgi:hypothetical protein
MSAQFCAQAHISLAVREQWEVSVQSAKACNEPISAHGNLRGHFAMRTSVAKNIPARALFAYIH